MQGFFYLLTGCNGVAPATFTLTHQYYWDLDRAVGSNTVDAQKWVEKAVQKKWYWDEQFTAAMEVAASGGNERVLRTLLTFSHLRDASDLDELVVFAAEHGHLPIIQMLEEYEADVHADNECAFRKAASNGHLKVVEYLASGLDVEALSAESNHAMLGAAAHGHVQVVRFLADAGVFLGAEEFQALGLAYMGGHWPVVDVCIEVYGARVILFQAVEWGYLELVKYICKVPLDSCTATAAARFAADLGHNEVASFLVQDISVLRTFILEAIIGGLGDVEELLGLWKHHKGSVEDAKLFFLAAATVGDRGSLFTLLMHYDADLFDVTEALWSVCTGSKSTDCVLDLLDNYEKFDPYCLFRRACKENDLFAFLFLAKIFPVRDAKQLAEEATGNLKAYIQEKLKYQDYD